MNLRDDVGAATDILAPADLQVQSFQTSLPSGTVFIPERIYNRQPDRRSRRRLTRRQQTILDCLYTRHHDGHVRQEHLSQIIGSHEDWVIPFVIRLVGEYVIEIIIDIRDGLADLVVPGSDVQVAYADFIRRNATFFELTSQRAESYYDAYYRLTYSRANYPTFEVLASMRTASEAMSAG